MYNVLVFTAVASSHMSQATSSPLEASEKIVQQQKVNVHTSSEGGKEVQEQKQARRGRGKGMLSDLRRGGDQAEAHYT